MAIVIVVACRGTTASIRLRKAPSASVLGNTSYLPRRLRNKDEIRPRLKAGRGERQALVQGILRNAGFFEAHGDCVARIRRGEQGVVFPAGTYRWHRIFGFPRVEATAGFYAMTNAFG